MGDEIGQTTNWNRDAAVALALRLRALKAEGKIKYEEVIEVGGLKGRHLTSDDADRATQRARERFTRWLAGVGAGDKWQLVDQDESTKIVDHLLQTQRWMPDVYAKNLDRLVPDPMFHGMVVFLGITPSTISTLSDDYPGVYTIYRHSLRSPGCVVIGRLEIVHDKITRAIKTDEQYHVTADDGRLDQKFHLKGYLFRRNNNIRILSKHISTDELQSIFIDSTQQKGGTDHGRQIVTMSGIVTDLQGKTHYSTSILFARGAPDALKTVALDDAENIRPHIAIELKRTFSLEKGDYIARI